MSRRHLFLFLAAIKLGVLVAMTAPAASALSTDGMPASPRVVATAATPATDFDQAAAIFGRARDGDHAAIAPALAQFTALLQARPDDPLLLAYAGAATAMQARATWMPWKKMGHAEDGLAMIDRALARLTPAHATELHRGVPVALETRLTAAGTFLALPAMFHRGERGRRLLEQVQRDPALAATPAAFREAVQRLAAKEAA
ncbi:hypothetical protein X805_10200 [Sphaerotilus natans subsp. natans DSM 6575]|uniref:Tetratricopeptide repeat protein n=1 Tax=Sphaerotilus natans subsp. natans DSM 6575 TaxID=1286631 RepID=A0A059KPY2_9BURK|nr:hypothetical protein [Sphaerotilus natans]KDB53435.1 hypothetical protein X805_10200 [Sphaerotilus natans subsp. natans DSM 6575]SIR27433.1 hypothetical protein SAMN05421778_10897 [Sphaerotilus natans]